MLVNLDFVPMQHCPNTHAYILDIYKIPSHAKLNNFIVSRFLPSMSVSRLKVINTEPLSLHGISFSNSLNC